MNAQAISFVETSISANNYGVTTIGEERPTTAIDGVRVSTQSLQGAALDWCVGRALGKNVHIQRHQRENDLICVLENEDGRLVGWSPSNDWNIGGPIMTIQKISSNFHFHQWIAGSLCGTHRYSGEDQLIAAMKTVVASKYGRDVLVPRLATEI